MLSRLLTALQDIITPVAAGHRFRNPAPWRRLGLEPLEPRQLLAATDLGAITGIVFHDSTINGYDPGEELAGATIRLYQDNGDNVLGTGDTLFPAATTNASGAYRFSRLTAGTYFVEQPGQTVSGLPLDRAVSGPLVISAADAAGSLSLTIDSFDTTAQSVTAQSMGGNNPDFNAADLAVGEAIGGERDLFAQLTSGNGEISLKTLAFGIPVLQFDSTSGVAGTRIVTWDGNDSNAQTLNATGLGGVDLTDGGNSVGIQLAIGADQDNGLADIRIFTDANHWSHAQAMIPNTGGLASGSVLVDFGSFQPGAGAAGPADLTDVGAVQLEIVGTALSVNGRLDLIGSLGQTARTHDFANTRIADLELDKSVDNATPDVGDNVTFTVTVTNEGPDDATGVQVHDALPAGLAFVSSSPTQGGYNQGSGTWTVGGLNVGASATLQLTATVTTAGTKTNVAQVSAAGEYDIDSTPNNGIPTEDDQDSVAIRPRAADLSVVKTVDNATPNLGDAVTFTVTVANAGPDTATGVALSDVLPAGLTFVRATPGQGSYNNGSGVWTVGTLANGGTANLQMTAVVNTLGTKVNTAQVSAADQFDPDSTPANNVPSEDDQDPASVTPKSADLSLTKTVNDATPNVGDTITFTVALANAGPDTAHNVSVRDPLPAGLTFVSSNPAQGSYNPATGAWTVGTLAVGQTTNLQISAVVAATSIQTNVAQVSGADEFDPDSTPGNNVPREDDQDSAALVPAIADLSVTKTVDNAAPVLGQNVTFTVAVANAGPDTATGVTVGDALPAGLTFVSATASRGSYNSGTGVWTVGTLPVGSNAALQLTATAVAGGTRTNTAQVTGSDQHDPDSTPGNGVPSEDDQDAASVTPRSVLEGVVYVDRDNDGVRDAGEAGIPGVTVRLLGNNNQGQSVSLLTTTAADGSYQFADVVPSNAVGYQIVESQPTGYLDGRDTAGSLGGQVATPSSTDRIRSIVVGSGVRGTAYNFGELRPAAISGRVYYDVNQDGMRQAGETGIAGVIVELTGRDDLGNAVNFTTTTNSNGIYRFTNLRPSNSAGYHLNQTQPLGYRDGQESAGTITPTPVGAGGLLQPNALSPGALTPQVLDDAFAGLVLEAGAEATNFDFGEVLNIISKRRFISTPRL